MRLPRSKHHSESSLRELPCLPCHHQSTSRVSTLCILFVPDVQLKASKTWLEESWAPLQRLIPADNNPLVLGFDFSLGTHFQNLWEEVLDAADSLVCCLESKKAAVEAAGSALVVIGQGIGGLVAKQALVNIYGQHPPPDQQPLQQFHQGTILLGVPHPRYSKIAEWARLRLLVLSNSKLSKLSKLQRVEAELRQRCVADISKWFMQAIIDTPVLSIHELGKTKISTKTFGSETSYLVDRNFAETGVPYEDLVGLSGDHHNLLRNPQADAMLAIKEFFGKVRLFATRQQASDPTASPTADSVDDAMADSDWSGIEPGEATSDGLSSRPSLVRGRSSRARAEISALAAFDRNENSLVAPFCMLKPGERNLHFFGRETTIGDIDKALLPQSTAGSEETQKTLQTFAICGMGGVGKTELAREYAFLRRDRFDAVFWVESEQTTQLSEAFAVIASKLGHDTSSDSDRVVSRNVALEWLSNPVKRAKPRSRSVSADGQSESDEASWLLIFNNADDISLLRDFWPVAQRGSILITSRDPMAKQRGMGVDLEPFTLEEAATLLRQSTHASDSEEDHDTSLELSKILGGLPLAVTQIAGLIEMNEMNLQQFLKYYKQQTSIKEVAEKKAIMLQDPYKHSLFTVWALESLTPQALAALRVMSFLSPDSINESLLELKPPATDSIPGDFPTTNNEFIGARLYLTKTSLIKRNKDTSQIRLHRLVQDVVRAQMADDITAQTFGFTAQLVLNTWPNGFLRFDHDTASWDTSEQLLPHILQLQKFYNTHLEMIKSHQIKKDFAKLLLFAGWYLLERSDFEAAKPLFLMVLDISKDPSLDLKETRADVLFALSALSAQVNEDIETNLGYAEDHFQCRLKLRDGNQFGENRMAMAYGELAHIQMLAGKYPDAIENARLAIVMTEKSPEFLAGEDWPTFSSTHLAFALAAQDRFDEAMAPLERSLAYWKSRASDTHSFQLGVIHRCIGFVKKQQGLQDQSHGSYVSALEHFTSTVGDKSHYVSQMCSNLGEYHAKQKEYETASMYLEQSMGGYRAHPCYKAQLALVLARKAQMQASMGDAAGSKISMDEARKLYAVVAKGYTPGTEITLKLVEAAVPMSSR